MVRVSTSSFAFAVASTLSLAALVGCQNDGSGSGGHVVSRTQHQDVTPGGTAVQTRTQIRETPSGERVRETEMRTRETVTPGADGSTSTPTK